MTLVGVCMDRGTKLADGAFPMLGALGVAGIRHLAFSVGLWLPA